MPQVLLDDKKRKIKHVQENYKPDSFHQATCLPLSPTNNYKETKNDSLKIKVITALQLVGWWKGQETTTKEKEKTWAEVLNSYSDRVPWSFGTIAKQYCVISSLHREATCISCRFCCWKILLFRSSIYSTRSILKFRPPPFSEFCQISDDISTNNYILTL